MHFERCVRETVDDTGVTPQELTKGLVGWDTMDRALRPPRSQWLYSKHRAKFKAQAGLGEVLQFAPLSGGAVVDTTPFWAKPGFVPEEGVS